MEEISKILTNFQFEEVDILSSFEAYIGQTPAEIRIKLEKSEATLTARINSLQAEAKDLSKNLDDLRVLYDYNNWRKKKNDLQHKIFRSDHLFAFEGWIVSSQCAPLEKWLQNAFVGDVIIEKIEPEKGEEVPVLLKNQSGVSSFEPIVDMFGLPKSKEFDPTVPMTIFFVTFFGLCLSDVGYGSILLGIGGWLYLFGKFSKAAKERLLLLVICGGATVLGGIGLGGYFGMTAAQAPAFLVKDLNGTLPFYGQLLNPMEGTGPILFLGVALGLGVVQLLLGVILDFVKRVLNKDYIGAICDPGAWFFFLLTILGYGAGEYVGLSKDLFAKLMLVGAGILVLTQGRDQKNWFLKPIFGVLGLYNITSYLSDLLSYSRIMALGLATGVVAFAMNITAGILQEMISVPVLGTLVAIAVILFGHTLNFALSTLGAFIHSGRLQFIEFFGKFYEGGGRKFTPFKREKKYLHYPGD